jgi:hypothetical protein
LIGTVDGKPCESSDKRITRETLRARRRTTFLLVGNHAKVRGETRHERHSEGTTTHDLFIDGKPSDTQRETKHKRDSGARRHDLFIGRKPIESGEGTETHNLFIGRKTNERNWKQTTSETVRHGDARPLYW